MWLKKEEIHGKLSLVILNLALERTKKIEIDVKKTQPMGFENKKSRNLRKR